MNDSAVKSGKAVKTGGYYEKKTFNERNCFGDQFFHPF